MTNEAERPSKSTTRFIAGRSRQTKRLVASWSRWLHIYTSMFGLAVTLFFAATGITLNHPDWFGETEVSRSMAGHLEPSWVGYRKPVSTKNADDPQPVDDLDGVPRLEVVEYLRKNHRIRGSLGQFSGDDRELLITFKGPGYSADVVIDRSSGECKINETSHGLVAVMNDLHKGRDTGQAWSLLIDISAVALCFISLTGLILIFFLRLRRNPGLSAAFIGGILAFVVYWLLVP